MAEPRGVRPQGGSDPRASRERALARTAKAVAADSPSRAELDAAVNLLAETRMDGVGYSIARMDPPFCASGMSGPLTLCYLVRKGTVWFETEAQPARVVELGPGTVVGTSGLVAHWLKSDARAHTRDAHALEPAPLDGHRRAGGEVEVIVGHAPLESLAIMVGVPDTIVIGPKDDERLSRRIWAAMGQIEEELTDPAPMGGASAAVRRLSEVILLNIVRHVVAPSTRDELDVLQARRDVRIMRATAAAAHGPLSDWTLGSLARIAGMSRTTFCERFRALTGQAPLQSITQMRLRLAASEIARGELRIGEIAEAAGYASPEAFTRAFSRYFGVTPRRFRATRNS
jgi:AraC-like DNA-binding protein